MTLPSLGKYPGVHNSTPIFEIARLFTIEALCLISGTRKRQVDKRSLNGLPWPKKSRGSSSISHLPTDLASPGRADLASSSHCRKAKRAVVRCNTFPNTWSHSFRCKTHDESTAGQCGYSRGRGERKSASGGNCQRRYLSTIETKRTILLIHRQMQVALALVLNWFYCSVRLLGGEERRRYWKHPLEDWKLRSISAARFPVFGIKRILGYH
jgi:hypothetical protein